MATLKTEPKPPNFVSFTELKNLRYLIDDDSDPDSVQRMRKEFVAEIRAEHEALENPELDCWACENSANLVQIKQHRTSFFRRLLSTDSGNKERRNYYCSSCGIWLAAFDWQNGWRLTGANTPTITTAQREGLMPSRVPQIYEDRRNIKCVTALGKDGKVVVFNSTGTMSATSQAMYKSVERALERAEAVEIAADIAFEMMTQLRKSTPEGTELDDFRGRYVFKNYEGTPHKSAGLLVRDKWYYMFSKLHMSKQEMDYQKRLRLSVIDFFGIVGPWDARWDDHVKVWYDLLWYLIQKHFIPGDKDDAMQAYIVTRRELQKLNLSSQQDEKRQMAVELAMQYVSLILNLKPWKKKKKNKVDVRVSMSTWWDRVLAKGTMQESPAERRKTVDRLIQEAEDWLFRVTPIKMIEYFIGKTMHGEPATVIQSCAAAQVHGMQIENWRRIDMDEANNTYTFKKKDS